MVTIGESRPNIRGYIKLLFNRCVDKRTDYISPGGYEVRDSEGNTYQFDFQDSYGNIDNKNPMIVEFLLRNLDLSSFQGADRIPWEKVVGFDECYVYLGEPDDGESPGLEVSKLLQFTIDTGEKVVDLPTTIFGT